MWYTCITPSGNINFVCLCLGCLNIERKDKSYSDKLKLLTIL